MTNNRLSRTGHAGLEILLLPVVYIGVIAAAIFGSLAILSFVLTVSLVYFIVVFVVLKIKYPKQSCLMRLFSMFLSTIFLFFGWIFLIFIASDEGGLLVNPVHMGAFFHTKSLTRSAIKVGFDVNGYFNGKTPLHYAADTDNPEMITVLVERGADATLYDKNDGYTPLHLAIKWNNTNSVKSLIKNGVSIEQKTENNGETPLILAVEQDSIPMAKLLISLGADVNGVSDYGSVMTHAIKRSVHTTMTELILNSEGYAEPDDKSLVYDWPLIELMSSHKSEEDISRLTDEFLQKGAVPDCVNEEGKTPLTIAEYKGYMSVVKKLNSRK